VFGPIYFDAMCTSRAERVNLADPAEAVRPYGTMLLEKLANLAAAVAVDAGYYIFHLAAGHAEGPHAAAGITSRPWSIDELCERVMQTAE
jgi:hypothetical protein